MNTHICITVFVIYKTSAEFSQTILCDGLYTLILPTL